MVGRDAARVGFVVADDVLYVDAIGFTQPRAELGGQLVHGSQVASVIQPVLAHLEADVAVVRRAAGVPASVIPRQRLNDSWRAVFELADKAVNADLTTHGFRILVPVIPVLVLTKKGLQHIGIRRGTDRLDIPLDAGIVSARRMDHDSGGCDLSPSLITGVLRQEAGEHCWFVHEKISFHRVKKR